MDYKLVFWIVSVLLTIYGYYSYIKSIFDWKTKPSVISWLIWSISTSVVFVWQLIWEWWYWVLWSWAIAFFVIFIFLLSLKYWDKNYWKIDMFILIISILSLLLWYFTNTPLYSVILLVFIDWLGFIPTFIKTYKKPFSEDLAIYFITGLIYLFWFIALENYNLLTILWPIIIGWINFVFVFFVLFLRKMKK